MSRISPFHLVDISPWPLVASVSGLSVVSGFLSIFYGHRVFFLFIALGLVFLVCLSWWSDVTRESTYSGFHTKSVQGNLLLRMVWFIISEVFFFFRFFWTFAHSGFDPIIELRVSWPPVRIRVLDPLGVPLLNTLVLLSSGFTVTWAHYGLLVREYSSSIRRIIGTIILRAFFTLLQVSEYLESRFNLSDSSYGSIFFLATGFHGFHVLVRSIFLLISTIRLISGHFSTSHHVGLECSIWYWHFVDVVWIFLYLCIYIWRSSPIF